MTIKPLSPAPAETKLPPVADLALRGPAAGVLAPSWSSQAVVPVTIGELPSHCFWVGPDTRAAAVADALEGDPELPGALIIADHRCLGVVSRQKCFQQLGRPFGVEVFLNRPVITLNEAIQYDLTVLPAHTRIDAALQAALARPMEHRYEPIVVQRVDLRFELLDLHTLLLAESRLLANANRLVKEQVLIGREVLGGRPAREVLDLILEHLADVMPYNRGGLVLQIGDRLDFVAQRGFSTSLTRHDLRIPAADNDVYQWLRQHKEPLCIPDVGAEQRWKYLSHFPTARSWLAVPLLHSGSVTGMLVVMRVFANIPFTADDVQIAETFAANASLALQNAHLEATQRRLQTRRRESDNVQKPAWGRLRAELGRLLDSLTQLAQAMMDIPPDSLNLEARRHLMGLQADGRSLQALIAQMPAPEDSTPPDS